MLFIHFLRQERIDIRDGDRFKRPLSFKQSVEEWPHRTTVIFNRCRGKTSVFFHKASEFTQHPAADRYRFGYSLETVEKGEQASTLCDEVFPQPLGMRAFRRRPVVPRHRLAAFSISTGLIASLGRSANLRYSAIDSKSRAFMRRVHLDIPCAAQ